MSAGSYPVFTTGQTIKLGLRCRCPRCGTGGLFYKYLKVASACANCNLGLEEHDTGDGPVVPAMLILGSIIVAAALYYELTFAPPLWHHIVLWTPVVIGLTMLILPPLKGLAIALQYRYRSTEIPTRPGGG